MDYISRSTALDTIVRTLEGDVLSRVDDSYARSQIWACAGILANIAVELRATGDGATEGTSNPDTGAEAAERLLASVKNDVSQQVSLHYKKAASGA